MRRVGHPVRHDPVPERGRDAAAASGIGRPVRKPWTRVTPMPRSTAYSACVSTPSATISQPMRRP